MEEDGDHMETEEESRKSGINLGNFRTEAEVLAVLHIKHPWMKVERRLTRTGNALLVHKDNRSQKLLMEVKSINGKECSFQPAETTFRKTYIMYNGRTAITRRGGTRGLQNHKMDEGETDDHNDGHMMKVVLSGKQHPPPPRFIRGYGSYRLRPYIREPRQCFNFKNFGHADRTCRSYV